MYIKGRARATDMYNCDHKSIEDALGYKIIVQLSLDSPNVNQTF